MNTASNSIIGVVTDCLSLNIRTEPSLDASILCSVRALSKLAIDESSSTEEWFSVCTETGVEGYCLKKFVAIAQ